MMIQHFSCEKYNSRSNLHPYFQLKQRTMAIKDFIDTMSNAAAACKSLVSRATLRLLRKTKGCARSKKIKDDEETTEYGLWQREILMGKKCWPLDFSGMINYDIYGNRIDRPVMSMTLG